MFSYKTRLCLVALTLANTFWLMFCWLQLLLLSARMIYMFSLELGGIENVVLLVYFGSDGLMVMVSLASSHIDGALVDVYGLPCPRRI